MNQRKKLVIILDEDHRMQIIVAWAYVLCPVSYKRRIATYECFPQIKLHYERVSF